MSIKHQKWVLRRLQISRPLQLLFACLFLCGQLHAADGSKTLSGHVPAVVAHLTAVGTLPATNRLDLAIGLPLSKPPELAAFLGRLYDPASPDYRHYLTPEQFADQFGPTPEDYEAVKAFARQNNLTVRAEYGNRLVLDVGGAVADIQRAFQVTLKVYHHPTESRDFYAPDTEPILDVSLPIADISGLNNYALPRPKNLGILPDSAAAKALPKTGSGPSGTFFGNDFRAAYLPGVTLTGAGQTLGLLEFSGYYASDITAYESKAGISAVPVESVLVDGYGGAPTSGGDTETSLDIEMAISMAPGLSAVYVFDAGPNGLQNDILASMVASDSIDQFSCSWGWGDGPTNTTDSLFEEMDAQGQTFFNASGDTDAFTVGVASDNGVDNPNLDNAPASCPYITQVGGTTLATTGPGGAWSAETAWNWGNVKVGPVEYEYLGTCGGVSSYYAIPVWQANVSMALNQGSTTFRNIPDVAANANNVYITYGNGLSTTNEGGTSCAAPMWAGLAALINEQSLAQGRNRIGFLNPAIYALGGGTNYHATFHDITSGSNTWSGSTSKYYAEPGYDLCTGWGTPNGQNLINALMGSEPLVITPTTGFATTGYAGGPFNTNSEVFTLTNVGIETLNWSVGSLPAWLQATPASGTLATHMGSSITLSLNAGSESAGMYTNVIVITDTTSGVGKSFQFVLQALEAMAIQPTNGFSASGYAGGPFNTNSEVCTLTNAGTASLNWSVSGLPNWLTATPASGTLAGHAVKAVSFSLAADAQLVGTYASTVAITDLTGGKVFDLSFGLQTIEALAFQPAGGFSGSGQVGGPFALTGTNLTLTNLGTVALSWSITAAPAWLTVAPTNGTLAGSGSAAVRLGLAAAAKTLAGGVYIVPLPLNDFTGQASQGIPLGLLVGQSIVQNGGFETGSFSSWTTVGDGVIDGEAYDAVEAASSYPQVVYSGNYGALLGDTQVFTLSQNLPTLPGQTYVLSFWLDNPSSGAGEQFYVNWITNSARVSQIYYVTNPPALAWTGFTFVLPATGTNTELQFGVENLPDFFGLDAISVTPIPNPAPVGLAHSGNAFSLTLYTVAGISYELLYATNLAQTTWIPLSTNTASATSLTITNSIGTDKQRFYRVLQLP